MKNIIWIFILVELQHIWAVNVPGFCPGTSDTWSASYVGEGVFEFSVWDPSSSESYMDRVFLSGDCFPSFEVFLEVDPGSNFTTVIPECPKYLLMMFGYANGTQCPSQWVFGNNQVQFFPDGGWSPPKLELDDLPTETSACIPSFLKQVSDSHTLLTENPNITKSYVWQNFSLELQNNGQVDNRVVVTFKEEHLTMKAIHVIPAGRHVTMDFANFGAPLDISIMTLNHTVCDQAWTIRDQTATQLSMNSIETQLVQDFKEVLARKDLIRQQILEFVEHATKNVHILRRIIKAAVETLVNTGKMDDETWSILKSEWEWQDSVLHELIQNPNDSVKHI